MKRFLFLPTIILAILLGCSEVNENIDTNSGHYEDNASNVANTISKLSPGIYTINVFGEINPVTISNIKAAMINNPKAKISLDLSNTTGLLGIDNEAFMGCDNLINITIPNNIGYIGNHAFSCCNNLVNITIPDSVTNIGYCAFDSCNSLTNIIIPSSVTSIGDSTFEYCGNLENVTIGSGVTTIGTNVFNECNNLKSVTFENTNDWYYSNEDNTDLTLINVTNESDNATYLRNIHTNYWYRKNIINTTTNDIKNAISELPAGLYTINTSGKITSVTIFNIKSSMINNTNAQISLDLSNTTGLQEIDNEAFSGCYNLTNIILPNSITYIGDSAFSGCSSLECIIIPDSVTFISNYAFSGCNNLKNITFENTNDWYHSDNEGYTDSILIDVTNKSDNAAYLRSIYPNYWYRKNTINTTTTDIKNTISKLPTGLYTINVNGEITPVTIFNIKSSMINNSNAKIFLDLSNTTGLLELDSESFSECHNLTNIILPNTVTYIGDRAFYNCYNLESIIIPDSVTSIDDYAFDYCNNLESVTIGSSVTTIGTNAFNECNNLTSVIFENTTDWYHSDNADYTDNTLVDVTNESNNAVYLRNIHPNYWCRKNTINTTTNDIENAISELPAGLYTINTSGKITPVTIFNIKSSMINNTNAQISLDLSNTTGLQEIDNEAFSGCYNLTNIILPNTVTYIGDRAFYNCYNLESIIIPDSVTSIDDYAFDYCNNLESVTIGSSVTTIGTNAFNECSNLTTINYKGTEEQWNEISIGSSGNEYLTGATVNYTE